MSYQLTTKQNKISIELNQVKYSLSLARTGGQGAQGRSVTNVELVGNDLTFSFSDGTSSIVGQVPTTDQFAAVAFSGSLDDLNTGTLDEGTIIGGNYGN